MSVMNASLQVSPVTGDVTPYYVAMQPLTRGTTTTEYVSTSCTYVPSTGVLNATASSARYADLAERYTSDSDYESGTVVVFGGEQEVTISSINHDTRVAGVISTNPAYLMNAENGNCTVALTGRVPCKVLGPVSKGTLLVTSDISGVAMAMIKDLYNPGCVIGKSLEEITENEIKTIEVVVGRL